MAEVSTFRCDECGKLKSEALQLPGRWYRALMVQEPGELPRFVILSWEDSAFNVCNLHGRPEIVHPLHLCGMGCALKAMAKAMEQSG